MSIFKCKMCGGTIEFEQGATVGMCDSCGTKQTLPRLDDDKKANLYDRANHFRRNNEFDKAMGIYEQILNEDNTDAEAYWSLVLCRYGIEYVEDPSSHKRVPTVNRAQFTSVFDDEDYKSAIQYADGYQKSIYEEEANAINEIQKGILAISPKEEPFDVFICYKETDNNGRRTQDSVLANDLYHQLTQEGYKVFFSRITLEDKLGTAYEPYIFAALNSAKIMVALGTKPEYFNAVWVKNEWSRYLSLVKNSDGKKVLIPAYRDMDPYDLPEEFSHLQAQDMSKLGFMQDLIRGINKIVSDDVPKTIVKETVAINNSTNAGAVAPLLKRAFMFLEDGKWEEADEYCEKVLDQDPECAEAYLGKLMAELKVKTKESIKESAQPFDNLDNCIKASRFDSAISEKLKADNDFILDRNETARKEGIYNDATYKMSTAHSKEDYKSAANLFKQISGYYDSNELLELCLEKAEIVRKDNIYDYAKSKMKEGDASKYSKYKEAIRKYKEAIRHFESIIDWKDSRTKIDECYNRIEEIKFAEEEARIAAEKQKAKIKKIAMIVTLIIAVIIIFIIILNTVIIPTAKHNNAIALLDKKEYDKAYAIFNEIGDESSVINSIIERFNILFDEEKYKEAYSLLDNISNNEKINNFLFERAIDCIEKKDYTIAIELKSEISFTDEFKEKIYKLGSDYMSKQKYDEAYFCYNSLYDYKESKKAIDKLISIDPSLQFKFVKGLGFSHPKFGNFKIYDSKDKEELEWKVLAIEDNRVLLLCDDPISLMPYNEINSNVTWQTSSIRKWLNNDFYNSAFSNKEKAIIETTNIINNDNEEYKTEGGENTNDKVFLLSVDDIQKYDSYYGCTYDGEFCSWWLRSPGSKSNRAAIYYISNGPYSVGNGKVDHNGLTVDRNEGVRPAIWINIGN